MKRPLVHLVAVLAGAIANIAAAQPPAEASDAVREGQDAAAEARTLVVEPGTSIAGPAVVRDIIPLNMDPADIEFRREQVDLPTGGRADARYLVVRWEHGAVDSSTFYVEPSRPLTNTHLVIPEGERIVIDNGRALVTVQR